MTWVREGHCCKCGDCCRGDPFDPHSLPDQPCPLLTVTNKDGTRLCKGYGVHSYYLSGCNVWPTVPEHTKHIERCTYTWRWE